VLNGCGAAPTNPDCELQPLTRALIQDIVRAEDVAIRYADARGKGGEWRALREQCEATLFSTVAAQRGIERRDVDAARGTLDQCEFDVFVHLPMAAVAIAIIALATSRVITAMQEHDTIAFLAVLLICSFGVALAVVAAGHLWSAAVETLRIGNGHLSYRAARIPWSRQRLEIFTLILVAFWYVALRRRSALCR
jgi:hypothetical protein